MKKIRKLIDNYVVKRFKVLMPKDLIKALYKQIATSELKLSEKIIKVKKGKIKYKLLILKDKSLKTVFNLGRHPDFELYKK